jgi:Alpha-glutamyl/putrescinyl thymine pyrophosphorylase clade 2
MNKEHFEKAVAFGRTLITTGDLDPVYIAIYRTKFDRAMIARWMLAYSCLYHLAASVFIAQKKGKAFWELLQEAAVNEGLKWPRGSERRHWRGRAAVECVAWLRKRYKLPEGAADMWAMPEMNGVRSCAKVLRNVQETPYYGPWIAFKVADLLERVAGVPVDFSQFELGVYSEPRKGAALLLTGDAKSKITDAELRSVVDALQAKLGRLCAPPDNNRPVNVQEIETVLCKYKSHVGGHYPLGKDTLEVAHGLQHLSFQCAAVKRMQTVIEPMTKSWK